MTIEMEYVVHSDVIRKSGNRSTFRIIYSNENRDFKNYDFECSQSIAGMAVHYCQLKQFGNCVEYLAKLSSISEL